MGISGLIRRDKKVDILATLPTSKTSISTGVSAKMPYHVINGFKFWITAETVTPTKNPAVNFADDKFLEAVLEAREIHKVYRDKNTRCCVYLMDCDISNVYKIGLSNNPYIRINEVAGATEILHIIQCADRRAAFTLETWLKHRYSDLRRKHHKLTRGLGTNEWFELDPLDVAYIKRLEYSDDGGAYSSFERNFAKGFVQRQQMALGEDDE